MTNFKNDFIARGTVVDVALTEYDAEMRMKVKETKSDKFTRSDETCSVHGMNGTITLKINDENIKFEVHMLEQAPNFTAGIRQKKFVGFEQVLKLADKFEKAQDAGKELKVQLKGHLEDGTFYNAARDAFVERVRWCVDYVNYNSMTTEMCRASINAMYYEGILHFARPAGFKTFQWHGKLKCKRDNLKTFTSGNNIDVILERHCEEEETEEGYINRTEWCVVHTVRETKDTGAQWGYVREENCEAENEARGPWMEGLRANAQ